MPAIPFNETAHSLAAITVQSLVPFNPDVITELQPEDFLLIEQCLRSGSSERLQETDKNGNLVLDIHFNQKLTYAVTARVLEFSGLADYHPGRALSDQSLAFANGRRAFQFTQTGKLIYLDPRQTISRGDLPGVEFTVEHLFIDLDEAQYPGSSTILYIDLAAQLAATPAQEACFALLSDVFLATLLCTGAVTATLYNGDPAGSGVALGTAASAAWTSVSDTMGDEALSLDAAPEIIWTGTPAARHITHIRVLRPGLVVLDIVLADPVDVPPWYYLRASVSDLLAKLRWPWSTAAASTRPGRFGLRHLLGDATTGFGDASATLTVRCYDDDPATTGVMLDEFIVPRDNTAWNITGNTAENLELTGDTSNPEAFDWVTQFVAVTLSGVGTLVMKIALSGDITTPPGQPIVIPAGALSLALT